MIILMRAYHGISSFQPRRAAPDHIVSTSQPFENWSAAAAVLLHRLVDHFSQTSTCTESTYLV